MDAPADALALARRLEGQAVAAPHRAWFLAACLAAAMLATTLSPAASPAANPRQAAPRLATMNDSWEFNKIGLENALFPSLMLGVSTLRQAGRADPRQLGDPNGVISVEVMAPRDKARVAVEIDSSILMGVSRFEGVLPWKKVRYTIAPYLRDLERLVLVRQPFAEVFTAKLWVDGVYLGEKSARVMVRSINDCVYRFEEDGERFDSSWLFASYANENHPAVESLLREALALGETASFEGYGGDADSVRREVRAIWAALQKRELAYSNMVRASGVSNAILCQHVRLLGEVLENRQANCVEASCLVASICYKISLEPFLVLVPGHMFVGVFLEPGFKNPLFLETTALSGATFDKAVEAGQAQAAKYGLTGPADAPGAAWSNLSEDGPRIISISGVREAGVMPIREPEADRTRFLLLK